MNRKNIFDQLAELTAKLNEMEFDQIGITAVVANGADAKMFYIMDTTDVEQMCQKLQELAQRSKSTAIAEAKYGAVTAKLQ